MKYLIPLVIFGLMAVTNRASADFYYTGSDNDVVYSLSASGVSTPYAADPSLADATGITLDSAGNVYVAIGANSAYGNAGDIMEISALDQSISTFATIPNVFAMYGTTVSAQDLSFYGGSVYALDSGNNTVIQFSPDGTSNSVYGYANYSFGLTFSAAGTAYSAGYGNSYLGELDQVVPAAVLAGNLNTTYGGAPGGVAVSPLNGKIYVAMAERPLVAPIFFSSTPLRRRQPFSRISGLSPLALMAHMERLLRSHSTRAATFMLLPPPTPTNLSNYPRPERC